MRPARALGLLPTLAGLGLSIPVWMAGTAAMASPVQCITSLEAPIPGSDQADGGPSRLLAPVEVTRCAPVQTVPQLIEQRAFSWTAPFARGTDVLHQLTDLLGIAMGGEEGNRVMGLGFQDQALIWDGSAIRNTVQALMEQQSGPMPIRTTDLSSVFTSSLAVGQQSQDASAIRSSAVRSIPVR